MKVSANFSLEDFDCHDGTEVPVHLRSNVSDLCVGILQPIRNKWGPVVVTSGFRTVDYNEKVGGKPHSTHLTAMAADIQPLRFEDMGEFTETIEGMYRAGQLPALGGFGKYKRWCHVDLLHAADGHLRRWLGTGIGSEP